MGVAKFPETPRSPEIVRLVEETLPSVVKPEKVLVPEKVWPLRLSRATLADNAASEIDRAGNVSVPAESVKPFEAVSRVVTVSEPVRLAAEEIV